MYSVKTVGTVCCRYNAYVHVVRGYLLGCFLCDFIILQEARFNVNVVKIYLKFFKIHIIDGFFLLSVSLFLSLSLCTHNKYISITSYKSMQAQAGHFDY